MRQAVLSVLPCALSGFKSCSKATVARVLQARRMEGEGVLVPDESVENSRLGKMGWLVPDALELDSEHFLEIRLSQALQDESADVREAAVQTLPLLAEPGKEVVDALLPKPQVHWFDIRHIDTFAHSSIPSIHSHILTHSHTFTHSHIHTFIHSRIEAFTHSYIHALKHSHIDTFMYSQIRISQFAHVYVQACNHSHIRTQCLQIHKVAD